MLDGDAAGDCKGVVLRAANLNRSLAGGKRSIIPAFARSAPLLGFFGAPFLPKQERCKLIDKLKFEHE